MLVGPQFLAIYTDKTIYSCLNRKSYRVDEVKMAVDHINDRHSVVNWVKAWLFKFNPSKTGNL